jgi:hypothetical protein
MFSREPNERNPRTQGKLWFTEHRQRVAVTVEIRRYERIQEEMLLIILANQKLCPNLNNFICFPSQNGQKALTW